MVVDLSFSLNRYIIFSNAPKTIYFARDFLIAGIAGEIGSVLFVKLSICYNDFLHQ